MIRSRARGRFVTLEGGEGAGKSTQIRLLAQWLQTRGITVLTTREPGGTAGAERIRALLVEGATDAWTPMTEALLNYAARHDHVTRVIRPALAAGTWVLSDRFADSTMAYQGHGHALGRPTIAALHRAVLGRFQPDLTLILDIPVVQGLTRAAARRGAETRYESMVEDFHHRVRAGFRAIARAEPGRCALIDARAEVDLVHRRVTRRVARLLGDGSGSGSTTR
jgi:dTMP kinase